MMFILDRLEGRSNQGGNIQTKYDDLLQEYQEGNIWNLKYSLGIPRNKDGNEVEAQCKIPPSISTNNSIQIMYHQGHTDKRAVNIGKSLIHEAFHAYLGQKVLRVWGSTNPTKWVNETKDMDLKELFRYIEITQNKNLENLSHNFMADNMLKMIAALKEFVDPTNAHNLPDDAYRGLLLEGLYDSNYYKTNILNSTEKRDYNGTMYNLPQYFILMSSYLSAITLEGY